MMRHSGVDRVLGKIKLKNIWVFLTERCNLNCDYCFYRHRDNKSTLSYTQIDAILEALKDRYFIDVVISGGEPLLEWEKVKYIIERVREAHDNALLTVQTNMYLCDEEKIKFFYRNNVSVEPGIDGLLPSNERHRVGIDKVNYDRYIQHIRAAVAIGLHLVPTCTVHPTEVYDMKTNLNALVDIGLRRIEVHPAFFTDWDEVSAKMFLRNYYELLREESAERNGEWIGKGYSLDDGWGIDLVITARGNILPNWVYLCFPEYVREAFYLLRVTENGIVPDTKALHRYLLRLDGFYKQGTVKTYRQFSNFNAELAFERYNGDNHWYRYYRYITEKAIELDRYFLAKEAGFYEGKV